MNRLVAVTLLFLTLNVGLPINAESARAASPIARTVGQLLEEGYQLHSVTVIDEATARRMSGSDSWKDDLMLTLTKGADFAFCHVALGAVTTGIGLKSGPCNVAQ